MKLLTVNDESVARSPDSGLYEVSDDAQLLGDDESGIAAMGDPEPGRDDTGSDEAMEPARRRDHTARPPAEGFHPWQDPDAFNLPAAYPHKLRFLVGERQHRLYPLDVQKIDYIESDGNYVTIRSGNSDYLSRDSLKRLSADLADLGFVRIERSLLLNIRAVAYVETAGHGTFAFTLFNDACLHSSATYRDAILSVLPLAAASRRRP